MSFSKEEIAKRINEIKYLSAQKKVPKLTLRKEIMFLEQKLGVIFQLEKNLLQKKQYESAKIVLLKKRIAALNKQLAASRDKDLNKKVDKLLHLLAEDLARKRPEKDLVLNDKAVREMKSQARDESARLNEIEERLEAIKRKLSPGSEQARGLQEKINMIEQRLKKYKKGPAIDSEEKHSDDKHTMLFSLPVKPERKPVEELPLPPPPKIVKIVKKL